MSDNPLSSTLLKAIFLRLIHAFLFIGIIFGSQTAYSDSNLPDIGGPESIGLSPGKEIELGKILIAEIRRALPIINDPELSQYIHSLGTRIISGGLNSNFPFTFLLVYDDAINAFAMPGGIVVINTGLLILAEKESEVASVVAHEIAHITQRHIARNFTNAKTFSVFSALSLLGTIVAAAYGGGEAATAAAITSQSALQEKQLAYSRSFEKEADRVGMQLMISANIDPQGMPDFFERMNKETQLNRGRVPEFLRSHPLTQNRIIESQDRANQQKGKFTSNTIHFDYARARAIAISANPAQMVDFYNKQSKTKKLSDTDHYIYAGVLSRINKNRQAIRELGKINIDVDNELTIKLAYSQVYLADRQTDEAELILSNLDKIYPNHLAVTYYYATALIDKNQAYLAYQKLDQLNNLGQFNPSIYKLKAKAASKAGMPWLSHESLSDYYALHGQYGAAMEQIQLSLRSPGIDGNSTARVEAKKNQIRELRRKREEFK